MAYIKSKDERDFRLSAGIESQKQNFNSIKVGKRSISDNVGLRVDNLPAAFGQSRKPIKKEDVEKALLINDIKALRRYSRIFFRTSGIYSRLCRYMASLYRYDWFITPIIDRNKVKKDAVVENWYKASKFLDNSDLKLLFNEIALTVIKDGCYYGYLLEDSKDKIAIQELPVDYCRSRYKISGTPTVEFNMRFFDDKFSDPEYRLKVLKLWPKEVQKGYVLYLKGKLPKDRKDDIDGWLLLDPKKTVKFNINGGDYPIFSAVIPKLLDLLDAQELDRKKMLQEILKIIIQTMPIDKNGDLIFDVEEAQQLHANAVAMLGDAIGVDVLTTFADVEVADLSDKSNLSSVDQLDKIERTVYNESGTAQNLFNTDGNTALEKSILNDEATMSNLVLQLERFGNLILERFAKNSGKITYKFQILPTTVYNYKDLSKHYKDLTSIGFSKLLPQVALGQSQSAVLMTAILENDFLDLNSIFVPPQMSSTISANGAANGKSNSDDTSTGNASPTDQGGRPPLDEDQKTDKTIANQESEG